MKVKGVGAFEQHVEKIVLAAVSVVFLLVVSAQLLLQPNQIAVGQEKRAPGRAYEPVLNKAQQVQAAMEPREQWDKPTLGDASLVQEFRAAREAPVASRPAGIAFGAGNPMDNVMVDAPISGTAAELAALVIPAPAAPFGISNWAAIDPGVVIAYPELQPLLPASQPFDKVYVTVEAKFDGTALAKALAVDPDGSGPIRAVPSNWHRDNTEIFAVRLEREELTTGGEWTNLTPVQPPPGMIDLLAEMGTADVQEATDLVYYVSQARQSAEDVQRPEFYRSIAGFEWLPPRDAARMYGGGDLPPTVLREFARLKRSEEELARTEYALESAREGPGARQPPRPNNEIANPRETRPAPTQAQQRITALENKIKSLKNEIASIEAAIRAAGFDPGSREPLPPAPVAASQRPLMSNPEVRVWAHDLTADPGKTYRYRVRVGISNPMFGRVAGLVASQAELARSPVAWSEPSEWYEVPVQGRELWYVTGASEGGEFGSANSTVEVYRMFYGFYRRGSTTLEPGDMLASEVKLPHQNLLPIYDMQKLKAGGGGAGGNVPPPQDLRTPPFIPQRDAEITLVPSTPVPPATPVQPQQPGDPPVPDAPPPLPADAKPWTEPIRVAIDVTLIDVARAAVTEVGVARAPAQAFLRVSDGLVVARIPDEDQNNGLRKLAERSAKQGETQGVPPPQVEDARIPGMPIRKDRPKPGDGGGGGGGGG